jgi:glucose-6-phosphate dehydrogenase assembly protein OpcA
LEEDLIPDAVRDLLFDGPCCELDPFHIGSTLRNAWREHRLGSPDEAQMRVCTHNLLMVCSKPENATGLARNLRELATLYPGRMVVVVLDSEAKGESKGWYRIESLANRPGKLSGELVVLHLPNDKASTLHSLLTPVWQDGVPVFLWWLGQPPYAEDWFETLVETSTRVILDSGGFRSSASSPEEVARLLEGLARFVYDRYHQDQTFSDLTWGRLIVWREWIASLFDPPHHRELLQRFTQVRIDCWAKHGDPSISLLALYTAGWMAHLLRWTVQEPLKLDHGEFVCHMRSNGNTFEVRFGRPPCEAEDLQRRLVAVSFEGNTEDGLGFHLSVERTLDQLFTLTRRCVIDGEEDATHAMQHARLAAKDLVGQQLETYGHDRVFEGALSATLAIVGLKTPVLHALASAGAGH